LADPTVVLQVVREIDRGHSTATEFTLDGVAVGKSGLEAIQLIGRRKTSARTGLR